MRAVGIGVGHEDDLAVTRLEVEAAAGAGADNLNDRTAAFLNMSPTEAFCTLRIFPRMGNNAWNSEFLAAWLSQGRVAFHDEQFGAVDVIAAAVDEFGRQ